MACCCFCFCNFLAVIGTTAFCETSPKAGRRAGEWDPQEIDTAQRRRRCVFIECVQQALRVFAQFVALECANYTHIYLYIYVHIYTDVWDSEWERNWKLLLAFSALGSIAWLRGGVCMGFWSADDRGCLAMNWEHERMHTYLNSMYTYCLYV